MWSSSGLRSLGQKWPIDSSTASRHSERWSNGPRRCTYTWISSPDGSLGWSVVAPTSLNSFWTSQPFSKQSCCEIVEIELGVSAGPRRGLRVKPSPARADIWRNLLWPHFFLRTAPPVSAFAHCIIQPKKYVCHTSAFFGEKIILCLQLLTLHRFQKKKKKKRKPSWLGVLSNLVLWDSLFKFEYQHENGEFHVPANSLLFLACW
jgi:hypothetical protein